MNRSDRLGTLDTEPDVLWEDAERRFFRTWRRNADGARHACIAVYPIGERPSSHAISRFAHEYALRDYIDGAWALQPLALMREHGQTILLLEHRDVEPLDRLFARPLTIEQMLRLALAMSGALARMHEHGLVHKDIKPANVLVDITNDRVYLTGFGIATRLPRERQSPEPPEVIAGTLSHMAPEQTGRMNRSIDSRSDLYSLGVTLYQMLTGTLPFAASDAMEWVHCHIARQPEPPRARVATVPTQLSAIVMKLLAKTPEQRYQTAAGVEHDLRRCLADRESRRAIDDFPPGEGDLADRLLIPERLYGREHEIAALLDAFDDVVASGTPLLALLCGQAGIGKSSVVNELHRAMVSPKGLFASGKFDQLKRDIPYATLGQAFQGLIRFLLGKPEAELRQWRIDLQRELSPNGALVVELMPELKFIIGEQPPVPDIPAPAAKVRFQMALRRLIGVFARAEHPLVLFLDDLQWLDLATLDLLQDLLVHPELQHLLLIGAYRNNEVDDTHPLARTLTAIRKSGAQIQEVVLTPLKRDHLAELIVDAFRCKPERAIALAQLLHERTAGNPLFASQFIQELVEEKAIAFDSDKQRWDWDLGAIRAKGYTDNVVDLLVGKLGRLSPSTQEALKDLACLGDTASTSTLARVRGTTEEALDADLWEALRLELIVRSESRYRFVHDRVQEAAYSLIAEEQRARAHLRIGRLLVAHTEPDMREAAIFELVGQLNRGVTLMELRDEREELAQLNLMAGKRAKVASAHASALNYFVLGAALVEEDGWQRRHHLVFQLELHRAECEFLRGEVAKAEERLRKLSAHTSDAVERSAVATMLSDVYFGLQRPDLAVAECLECLRQAGLDLPMQATDGQARAAYDRIWTKLGRRSIEELADLPALTDPEVRATLDLLVRVIPSATSISQNLLCLVTCAGVSLSLDHGNCESSCGAYVMLGTIAGAKFGDYEAGFRFGRLAMELVERMHSRRFEALVLISFANQVMPWTKHVRSCRELFQRLFVVAEQTGNPITSVAAYPLFAANLLLAGDGLVEVQKQTESGFEVARAAAFGDFIEIASAQGAFVRTLRGLTGQFGSMDDDRFDEKRTEGYFASKPHVLFIEFWYWVRKLQARFFAGDFAAALRASTRAQALAWTSNGSLEHAELQFYSALAHAGLCDSASSGQDLPHLEVVVAHHRRLAEWARHCPENFENRAALVAAEIARVEGRELEAERLYEAAIQSARENDFVHNEALANELAARFYAARGFGTIADAYLRNARYGYLRWGADGKVRQLDQLYPHLKIEDPPAFSTGSIGAPLEQLELATVIKVSQAVSGEMVLERLLDTLMRVAIEHAGAERAVLMLSYGTEQRIVADATTHRDVVVVRLCDQPMAGSELPETVLRYVSHTRQSVILDDAATVTPFSTDPYFGRHPIRSVLCLPLTNQAKLIGALYLENNLAPRVFAPTRITVLKLVASQAAISLENSRLYRDLAERESRIRRLVDANIIGIFLWELDGRIVEANDAFLTMVGYARQDFVTHGLRWTDLTPPEWRERDERLMPELKMSGTLHPFEKEYFRKDGSRVPVLIGVASFEGAGNQGVAYVVDLTERKRDQEALNRAGAELAHVSRVTALSALTASIAHEVNQPLSGIMTNAGTCLRMLDANPPNIEGARETARRTIRDGSRASEVIARLRALFSKRELAFEPLDLNEAAREVIALLSDDLQRNRIIPQEELADDLPIVNGDRIQLQQVVLNLVRNAADAMADVDDRERQLLIKTEREDGGRVRLSVRDAGVGLSLQSLDSLFDPFYTTKSGGMGIGLFVSRSIVERHLGRLWAEPNRDGPGATFLISIPHDAN